MLDFFKKYVNMVSDLGARFVGKLELLKSVRV